MNAPHRHITPRTTARSSGMFRADGPAHIAWLAERWDERCRAAGWTHGRRDTPVARACAAAFFSPARIRAAVAALGRERAAVPLGAALTELDLLFLTAVGHAPSDAVTGAYVVARHGEQPPPPGHSPVSGLPGEGLLRRGLTGTCGRTPSVVVVEPQISAYPVYERLRGLLLTAERAEQELGAAAHQLEDGRLGFAVRADERLPERLARVAQAPVDPLARLARAHDGVPALRASVVSVLREWPAEGSLGTAARGGQWEVA